MVVLRVCCLLLVCCISYCRIVCYVSACCLFGYFYLVSSGGCFVCVAMTCWLVVCLWFLIGRCVVDFVVEGAFVVGLPVLIVWFWFCVFGL